MHDNFSELKRVLGLEDDDRSKVCSHSGALSVVLYYLKEIEIINRVKMIKGIGMNIETKTQGNKQIRSYKVKANKDELKDVVEDILSQYQRNKLISIEVK